MRLRFRYVCAGLLVALATAGGAAGAVKPKPWAWTPAQATAQMKALEQAGRCVGKGKPVQKRYLSFKCGTLWVKVRPVGKGEPCWGASLATVPAACLNPKGVRVRGDTDDAERALRLTLKTGTLPYQGPNGCVMFGLGFFQCWWYGTDENDPVSGLGTVTLLRSGPVMRVTRQPTG